MTHNAIQVGSAIGLAATGAFLASRGVPLSPLYLLGGAAAGSAAGVAVHVATLKAPAEELQPGMHKQPLVDTSKLVHEIKS